MNLSLFDFKINEIIAGKIIKLKSTGVIVDFNNDRITDVPLKELSLADLQFPKEAVKLNEIREFLIVGNYDCEGELFFSNCSPKTLKNSIRLEESAYKYAQYITKQKGHYLSKEKFLIHTQIGEKRAGGVSVKIRWFVISQEHPPTVSFSIRELEIKKAWERLRQLQCENVTIYTKILKKTSSGAIVKIEGLLGVIRTYVDKHREELIEGKEIALKIIEVEDKYNRLVLVDDRVLSRIKQLEIGKIVYGTVRGIKPYGLYVELDDIRALLRTSTNSNLSVKNYKQVFQVNDRLQARLVELDINRGLCIIEIV